MGVVREPGLLAKDKSHDEGYAKDEQEGRVDVLDHLASAFVGANHASCVVFYKKLSCYVRKCVTGQWLCWIAVSSIWIGLMSRCAPKKFYIIIIS